MLIPEAAQLVLQAGAYAKGGEVFVLDMGKPVKIYDLAENLIKLSGYKPNEEIKIAFQEINKHSHLGTQYDWLARYCHEKDINEMGITAVFRYDGHIATILKNHVEKVERYNFAVYRIRQDAYKLPEGIIFKYFLFPTYEKSKLELFQLAQEKGWGDMINLTWFCHKPRAVDKPCGACEPCRQTKNYGLGFRIPYQNRIMGKIIHSVYDSKLFQIAKRAVKAR